MKYQFILVLATVIWGSSFVIVKDATATISPAWLIFARFTVAAILLFAFTWKKRRLWFKGEYLFYGALLGLAEFAGYYLQTVGITDTTPGKNAFLTATYCVIVPFAAWVMLGNKPSWLNVLAAFVCLAGIGLISLNGGFTIGWGDALTLSCAVFYAIQIVMVARFAPGRDIYVLTAWMFAVVALSSLAIGVGMEPAPDWMAFDAATWLQLAYLSLVVTALALLLQNIGLAHVPSSTAGLLLSLESVFGVAFSVALGAEVLTLRIVAGFCCVFAGIVISEMAPVWIDRLRARRRVCTPLEDEENT